jgi:hypothetical protein
MTNYRENLKARHLSRDLHVDRRVTPEYISKK